jgi:hypothetical protein
MAGARGLALKRPSAVATAWSLGCTYGATFGVGLHAIPRTVSVFNTSSCASSVVAGSMVRSLSTSAMPRGLLWQIP